MSQSPALSLNERDGAEELQRAELYGLLAQLWLAPPPASLLQAFSVAITQAPERGSFLEEPWEQLVSAMRQTTPQAAQQEFDALFQGVGKPQVFVYGSYHLSGFLNEKPLAELRADLHALGLTRDPQRLETEDHVAYVLEVMRYLIAGDDVAICNLEQQRRFFRQHVQPWVGLLCDDVQAQPNASLWHSVARLTAAFIQVETQGFDLLEL